MADFFFVLKTFLITFILIVLMQIKVSGRSIEAHMHRWIKKSAMVEQLRGVAHGAVSLLDSGYDQTMKLVETNSSSVSSWGKEQAAGFTAPDFRFLDDEHASKHNVSKRSKHEQYENEQDTQEDESSEPTY